MVGPNGKGGQLQVHNRLGGFPSIVTRRSGSGFEVFCEVIPFGKRTNRTQPATSSAAVGSNPLPLQKNWLHVVSRPPTINFWYQGKMWRRRTRGALCRGRPPHPTLFSANAAPLPAPASALPCYVSGASDRSRGCGDSKYDGAGQKPTAFQPRIPALYTPVPCKLSIKIDTGLHRRPNGFAFDMPPIVPCGIISSVSHQVRQRSNRFVVEPHGSDQPGRYPARPGDCGAGATLHCEGCLRLGVLRRLFLCAGHGPSEEQSGFSTVTAHALTGNAPTR
jgi:hypothetical protein